MAPRKKTTKKQQRSLLPAFIMGGIVALSFIITLTLQDTTLTTGSSAKVLRACDQPCSETRPCGAGLTCVNKGFLGDRCMCNTGNCIKSRCEISKGIAEVGAECDRTMTERANKGLRVDSLRVACKEGLACSYIVMQSGSEYRCCDPKASVPHPKCVSDRPPTP